MHDCVKSQLFDYTILDHSFSNKRILLISLWRLFRPVHRHRASIRPTFASRDRKVGRQGGLTPGSRVGRRSLDGAAATRPVTPGRIPGSRSWPLGPALPCAGRGSGRTGQGRGLGRSGDRHRIDSWNQLFPHDQSGLENSQVSGTTIWINCLADQISSILGICPANCNGLVCSGWKWLNRAIRQH